MVWAFAYIARGLKNYIYKWEQVTSRDLGRPKIRKITLIKYIKRIAKFKPYK